MRGGIETGEIENAIQGLVRNKSPGTDGLVYFYSLVPLLDRLTKAGKRDKLEAVGYAMLCYMHCQRNR